MSAAHTPGPWEFGGAYGHQYVRITANNHKKIIGTVRDSELDGVDSHGMPRFLKTEEGRANANLIAAAPELMEALSGMLQVYGGSHDSDGLPKHETELDLIEQARAAIAKATGSSHG